MKTYSPSAFDITRSWHLINAQGQILGRLATQVAVFLTGKHKPTFTSHLDTGDNVVIINSEKIVTTGKKEAQKNYYRHSGYPGGLKQTTLGKLREDHPDRIIIHAVSGMLPKNKLRDPRLKRLHVVIGDQHPYGQHFKS